MEDRSARIARITGQAAVDVRALSGGCVGQVLLVQLADGRKVVARLGPGLEPATRPPRQSPCRRR